MLSTYFVNTQILDQTWNRQNIHSAILTIILIEMWLIILYFTLHWYWDCGEWIWLQYFFTFTFYKHNYDLIKNFCCCFNMLAFVYMHNFCTTNIEQDVIPKLQQLCEYGVLKITPQAHRVVISIGVNNTKRLTIMCLGPIFRK